jgi:hypothetical protein
MLTQLAVLVGLVGVGYYVTLNRKRDYTNKETSMMDDFKMYRKDLREAGISWGTQRTQDLNLNNLNEAYKPRSAPTQIPTWETDDIFTDQADINAYVNEFGYPFYFRRNDMVPLASALQGNLNIEIPVYGQSFRGDYTNSLSHYPRVYSDKYASGDNRAYSTFTGYRGTMAAEEPESWEEVYVSKEGEPNWAMNPFGPGGVIQKLYNKKAEKDTRRMKTNRSQIGMPSKLERKRFTYGDEN